MDFPGLLAQLLNGVQYGLLLFLIASGLTLIGAHDSARPQRESTHAFWTQVDDQRVALELLARGRLNVQPYITHRFPWQDAPAAYNILKSWDKSALGILLDWSAPDEQ